jgi:integrase
MEIGNSSPKRTKNRELLIAASPGSLPVLSGGLALPRARYTIFATRSREAAEGINQRAISELLGHAPDRRTTAKYYPHADHETIRAAVLKLRPTATGAEKK